MGGGEREAHNQYKHSIKLLQKGFWTVCRISSAEKSRRGSKYVWGRKANKCKRYNLPHILNGVQCGVPYRGILSLSESQHAITLVTPRHALFIFSRKALTPSHVAVET